MAPGTYECSGRSATTDDYGLTRESRKMRSLKTESVALGTGDEDSDVILHDPSKPVLLRNTVCAYCVVQLTASNATKEHVVGRKFVPTGKLDKRWNLILRTCSPCNTRKSELEDDLQQFPCSRTYLANIRLPTMRWSLHQSGKPRGA